MSAIRRMVVGECSCSKNHSRVLFYHPSIITGRLNSIGIGSEGSVLLPRRTLRGDRYNAAFAMEVESKMGQNKLES